MNFKKLLLMFSMTLFVGSATIGIINTHVGNTKLIKNTLINSDDIFLKLEGTSGQIESITSDKDGNVYAANNDGVIYSSKNNEDFKQIFKSEGTIQVIVTSNKGNVYAAIKTTENETKIYMKKQERNEFELFQTFNINLLSMTVYTSSDNVEYLYIGTDKNVQVFYPEWGMLEIIVGTSGNISSIIKDNNNDKCIYVANTAGEIYKTIGGDQEFRKILVTTDRITDLTIDKLGNVYATEISGQVWKKDNVKNNFVIFQSDSFSDFLTSIITDNNNIYVSDNYGNVWKSDGSLIFNKFQIEDNIAIKKIIFNCASEKIYIGSSAGVYYLN